MAHPNINERQMEVQRMLLAGEKIIGETRKLLAAKYDCSIAAIYADTLSLTRPKNLKTPFLNPRIRSLVYARDGKECQYCDRKNAGVFIVEHIIPACIGGVGMMYNLTAACQSCNVTKRSNVWTPRNLDEITAEHPEWRNEILRKSSGPNLSQAGWVSEKIEKEKQP